MVQSHVQLTPDKSKDFKLQNKDTILLLFYIAIFTVDQELWELLNINGSANLRLVEY